MSGVFPTDPGPATVALSSNQPTAVDYAESGKSQSRIIGGHLWKAKLSWSRMLRETLSPIFAFATFQRGRLGSFQIVLPNYATPNGVGTGTPLVVGAHTAGDTSISTDGWTASQTGILKAGDVLKFANHAKVYMITSDTNSDGGSASTLSITPPLIDDLVDNEAITVSDVEFTMSLDDDVVDWKGSAPNLATISVNMTESL